jgi:hypothetical protein
MIVATPETNHKSVRIFRDKIQASLSTFFGRKKLGIQSEEDTLLMLGLDLAQEAGGYIPVPGVATAINIMVNVGKIAYENFVTPPIVSFNSFADIDRLSFLVAEGIAAIYSPQIRELNDSQARILAESAHDSLESFLKRAYAGGKTVITPDQLVLVLGKYHLGIIRNKNPMLLGNPHRRAVLLGKINGNNWYDMDLFLGSGINVANNGVETKFISKSNCAYYYSGGFSGLIYTKVSDKSSIYGSRIGTFSYANDLTFQQVQTVISTEIINMEIPEQIKVNSEDTLQEGVEEKGERDETHRL